MRYSGTSLTRNIEIDKAILDLLKKINELANPFEIIEDGIAVSNLKADTINITIPGDGESTTSWNSKYETLDITLRNGVVGQQFQELHIFGIAAEDIPNGNVVQFAGIEGGYVKFVNASYDNLGFNNSFNPESIIGVATQDISMGSTGYVTWFGRVNDLDTSAWASGTLLFLDQNNPGKYTDQYPRAGYPWVNIGIVENSDLLGDLFVRPSWGDTLTAVQKDPTGFDTPENITVTYDSTARTITLTGTFQGFWQGNAIRELHDSWTSPAHPAGVTTSQFLYYDGTDYVWSSTPWTYDMLHIAYVSFDTLGFHFATRECHGLMPWTVHEELHQTIGTYLQAGGDLSSYVIDSVTAENRRPNISDTQVKDEDNITVNRLKDNKTNYTYAYLTGTGQMTFTTGASDIIHLSGAQPYYNLFTGGAWTQALVDNNTYTTVWLLTIPVTNDTASQNHRYVFLQGQGQGTLLQQQLLNINNINFGNFTNLTLESIAITKIILRYQSGDWSISQVDKLIGTRINQVASTSGAYLSAVATDSTMTGLGTVTSPLSIGQAVTTTSDVLFHNVSASNSIAVANPNNGAAFAQLNFLSDVPRIRYGGTGAGSGNGFKIVGTGDITKLTIGDNGDLTPLGNVRLDTLGQSITFGSTAGQVGYIRQHPVNAGQLQIGSDDAVEFIETDAGTTAVSISCNNKTVTASGGFIGGGFTGTGHITTTVNENSTHQIELINTYGSGTVKTYFGNRGYNASYWTNNAHYTNGSWAYDNSSLYGTTIVQTATTSTSDSFISLNVYNKGSTTLVNSLAIKADGNSVFSGDVQTEDLTIHGTQKFTTTNSVTLPTVASTTLETYKIATISWTADVNIKVLVNGSSMNDVIDIHVLQGNAGQNKMIVRSGRNNLTYGLETVTLTQTGGTYNSDRYLYLSIQRYPGTNTGINIINTRMNNDGAVTYSLSTTQTAITGTVLMAANLNSTNSYSKVVQPDTDIDGRLLSSGEIFNANGTYNTIMNHYELDLTSLSSNNFYPVYLGSGYQTVNCEIHSPNVSGSSAYNQNTLRFTIQSQGWSDTPVQIEAMSGQYQTNEITIGSVVRGTQAPGGKAVYLRGGLIYKFNSDVEPQLKTSNYTTGSETYTVGTGYSGGTNTNVSAIWLATDNLSTSVKSFNGAINCGTNLRIPTSTPSYLINGDIWIA